MHKTNRLDNVSGILYQRPANGILQTLVLKLTICEIAFLKDKSVLNGIGTGSDNIGDGQR